MIVGYHLIFGAYGFWLPNDPRGSWSDFVGSWELFRYGPATKTEERHSVARRPHDRVRRLAAKEALQRPAVEFTDVQVLAIGAGFANYVLKSGLPVWACAIMPDHVHLVVGPPGMKVEQLAIQLKGAATERLKEEGLHLFGAERREGPHAEVFCPRRMEGLPRSAGRAARGALCRRQPRQGRQTPAVLALRRTPGLAATRRYSVAERVRCAMRSLQ